MEIFFTNIFDKNRINLTRNSKSMILNIIIFSPDGQSIVFTSERDGDRNIYIMNTDGTNQERITSHPSSDYEPVFSPDGFKHRFYFRKRWQ